MQNRIVTRENAVFNIGAKVMGWDGDEGVIQGVGSGGVKVWDGWWGDRQLKDMDCQYVDEQYELAYDTDREQNLQGVKVTIDNVTEGDLIQDCQDGSPWRVEAVSFITKTISLRMGYSTWDNVSPLEREFVHCYPEMVFPETEYLTYDTIKEGMFITNGGLTLLVLQMGQIGRMGRRGVRVEDENGEVYEIDLAQDYIPVDKPDWWVDEESTGVFKHQEGGSHYASMAIQPIEYIHANQLGFIEGAIVKYISRHRAKGGAEDIRKIIHFAEMLLELEYEE